MAYYVAVKSSTSHVLNLDKVTQYEVYHPKS